MLNEQEKYNKALAFATKKHSGQFRIGGEEYITHPVTVAKYVKEWGYNINYQIAALFHDLLEDTNATEAEILSLGGEAVLKAVELLTKKNGYVMKEYVEAIKKDDIAKTVKAADRLHNLCSAVVADEDFKRRYIIETKEWYLDFSPLIPQAVNALEKTIKK